MGNETNEREVVQFELMHGRDATRAIAAYPVGYLPIGGMERHGDHLPMGLDILKAHRLCCLAARAIGGVVFPPHHYAAIHGMTVEQLRHFTGDWGDIFTDASTKSHLIDVIRQIALARVKVLVLYSGHYPKCQVRMIEQIAEEVNAAGGIAVIPFAECMILQGDHAGVSETSLMLYLDAGLVDMTRIGEENYRDHGWDDANDPKHATVARGEAEAARVIDHLREQIARVL